MLRRRTILIVDDSEAIRHHVERVLSSEQEEFQVLAAKDGLSASTCSCAQGRPGAVRRGHARIDGFKFLTLKNSRPELAIYQSSCSPARAMSPRRSGARAGAADYLTKPFHDQELVARVRVHLKLRALQEELRVKNEQLQLVSRTDELTGLWNRRHLMEPGKWSSIGRAVTVSNSGASCWTSIISSSSTTAWHLVGDQVLSAVAEQLQQDLRKCDLVARYGGEEFVVLLPQTGSQGAHGAERQRLAVAALRVPWARPRSVLR